MHDNNKMQQEWTLVNLNMLVKWNLILLLDIYLSDLSHLTHWGKFRRRNTDTHLYKESYRSRNTNTQVINSSSKVSEPLTVLNILSQHTNCAEWIQYSRYRRSDDDVSFFCLLQSEAAAPSLHFTGLVQGTSLCVFTVLYAGGFCLGGRGCHSFMLCTLISDELYLWRSRITE